VAIAASLALLTTDTQFSIMAGLTGTHRHAVTVIIAGALINGVRGTVEMAAVRRDAATVPPAPERGATSRAM
jgi:hypothetical protein